MTRAKYLAKMILISIDEKKATLLKEADAYVKQQPKISKLLTYDKFRHNDELFKKITERILKVTE